MAKYKPGQSGNPKGRPKGSKADPAKNIISNVLKDNGEKFNAEMGKLTGRDFCEMYLKAASFIIAKPKEVEVKGEVKTSYFVMPDGSKQDL